VQRQAKFLRERRYKLFILVRCLSAQFVIEMNDAENYTKNLPQFEKKSKKSNGIRAARHLYTHALSRTQKSLLSNVNL